MTIKIPQFDFWHSRIVKRVLCAALGVFLVVSGSCKAIKWITTPTAPQVAATQVEEKAKVVEQAEVPPPVPGYVDTKGEWGLCVEVDSVEIQSDKLSFEAKLHNGCKEKLPKFIISYKVKDAEGFRIGWMETSIGELDPGEKVRYTEKLADDDDHKYLKHVPASMEADSVRVDPL